MSSKEKTRIHYLDGIRGMASLLVVFGHFKYAFFDQKNNSKGSGFFWNLFDHFFLSPEFCVQLFFVLSGFILTYNSIHNDTFLSKQWYKRLYRLFIPVFISSLFYFIFIRQGLLLFKELSAVHSNKWISQQWTSDYNFLQFLTGCVYNLMIISDYRFILNINSALWTIPVELYWSYCLFVCLWLQKLIKARLLKNIFLCMSIMLIVHFALFKGTMYGLLFMGGSLLAGNYYLLLSFFKGKRKFYLFICIMILTYCVDKKLLGNVSHLSFSWSYPVAILCIFSTIVILKIQFFFLQKPILWLGRISFSLYLLHMLVLGSLGAWLYTELNFLRRDWGLFLLLLITLIVSFIIAWIFTKYIDEPLMNLFDKYYKKRRLAINKKSNPLLLY